MSLVGSQLGNYKLQQHLGTGAFADVYLGVHVHLGTQAAIKVLKTTLATKEEVEQFTREAKNSVTFSHPNLVRTLDFGMQEETTPYLVMEYMAQGTVLKRHPAPYRVPLPFVIIYVKQVAEALQYLHQQGAVHRDVKPANLLLAEDGRLMLGDFGIIKVIDTLPNTYAAAQLTWAGTRAYMAPEQGAGRPDFASDQYALAVVAYEWLSGSRPVSGDELPTLPKEIPNEVRQVLMKALQPVPTQRYPTISQFAAALEAASTSSDPTIPGGPPLVQVPTPSKPPITWRRLIAALVAGVVLGALLAGILEPVLFPPQQERVLVPGPTVVVTATYTPVVKFVLSVTSLQNGAILRQNVAITCSGTYQGSPPPYVWVVLKDAPGNLYVQSPPVEFHDGKTWVASNIRPGLGIIEIDFVQVTSETNILFLEKVQGLNGGFGAFTPLPAGSMILASLSVQVQ